MNFLVIFAIVCFVGSCCEGSPLLPANKAELDPQPLRSPDEVEPELFGLSDTDEDVGKRSPIMHPNGTPIMSGMHHVMPDGELMDGESHAAWQTDGEASNRHLVVKRDVDSLRDHTDLVEEDDAAFGEEENMVTRPYNETFHYNLMRALSGKAENEVDADENENLDGNREEVDDAEFNTREARDETDPARVKERGNGGEQEKLISAIDNPIQRHEVLTKVLKSFVKLYEVVKSVLSDKQGAEDSNEANSTDTELVELEKRAHANFTAVGGVHDGDNNRERE